MGLMGAITVLRDEALLHFNDDHLEIRVVDEADVAIVEMETRSDAFETLSAPDFEIGCDISDLVKNISAVSAEPPSDTDRTIVLTLTENGRLKISSVEGSMSIKMGLIPPEKIDDEPDIPSFNHHTEVTVDSNYFSHVVSTTDRVIEGSNIEFFSDADAETFTVRSTGDIDNLDATLNSEHPSVHDIVCEDVEAIYSSDYLSNIFGGLPEEGELIVRIGDTLPAEIHGTFLNETTSLTYTVAPRVEENR